jgi:hypothetical protein
MDGRGVAKKIPLFGGFSHQATSPYEDSMGFAVFP